MADAAWCVAQLGIIAFKHLIANGRVETKYVDIMLDGIKFHILHHFNPNAFSSWVGNQMMDLIGIT